MAAFDEDAFDVTAFDVDAFDITTTPAGPVAPARRVTVTRSQGAGASVTFTQGTTTSVTRTT